MVPTRAQITAAVLAAALLAGNGCGGADSPDAAAPTTTRAARTTASTTTSGNDTSTTTDGDGTDGVDTSANTAPGEPASAAPEEGSDGSPATPAGDPALEMPESTPPEEAPPLGDGTWAGIITGVDLAGRTIEFDAARLTDGAEALAAALRDGVVEPGATSVPGGHYLVNTSPLRRTLAIAPTTAIALLASPDAASATPASFEQLESWVGLTHAIAGTSGVGVTITIERGSVTRLDQIPASFR